MCGRLNICNKVIAISQLNTDLAMNTFQKEIKYSKLLDKWNYKQTAAELWNSSKRQVNGAMTTAFIKSATKNFTHAKLIRRIRQQIRKMKLKQTTTLTLGRPLNTNM